MPATKTSQFGSLLRYWRGVRKLSQLDVALAAEVSPRHLSFLETGRSRPSREMVLLLAEVLAADVPSDWRTPRLDAQAAALVPMRLARDGVELSLFSAITTLGTPQDVTLQELRLETLFPADEASSRVLRQQAG